MAAGADTPVAAGPTRAPHTADVSVRPAISSDVPAVVTIQFAAWRSRQLVSADELAYVDTTAVHSQWEQAISRPPSARHRVLSAVAGPVVVGFLALAPVELDARLDITDAAEIIALEVDAEHTRQGHGARLLAACVDLAREAGVATLVAWVSAEDAPRTRFLTSAGFGPTGLRRTLSTGHGDVVEHLWRTEL